MPSSITPELVYRLTAVTDPSLSSTGSLLAFTRSSVDRATMEYRSSIEVMGMPAHEARPLTEGPHDTSARFAPDESAVAFLREDSDERRQLWVTPAASANSLGRPAACGLRSRRTSIPIYLPRVTTPRSIPVFGW